MATRTIGKYHFLVKLVWTLIRPLVVKAANDDADDTFSMEIVELLDNIIAMDLEELFK